MQPMAGGISLQVALGTEGQAGLIHVFDAAWDVATGKMLQDFPTDQDGFPFFTSPTVSSLSNDGRPGDDLLERLVLDPCPPGRR